MSSINPKQLAYIYSECTCQIYTYSDGIPIAQGSGVLLADKGIILTNYHTFIGSNSHKVFLHGKEIPDCKIFSLNGLKDLVLIYSVKTIKMAKEISICTETNIGDKVYTFGFPLNYGLTMTEGIVSNLQANLIIQLNENQFTKMIKQSEVMQVTAPISRGSSGGALVNEMGELIGITTYSDKAGMGINFAIPINEAITEINEFEKLKEYKFGRKEFTALDNYCLGINLMENANYKDAYKMLKKAYAILPNHVNILNNLSVLAIFNKDYDNAAKYIYNLTEMEGTELQVIRCKTILFMALKKFPECIEILNEGLKLFPNNQFLFYNKAWAYFEMNKYQLSLKMIDKSLEIDEEEDEFIKLKAQILEKLKDFEGAISFYEFLLDKYPNDIDINFKLAELTSNLGYDKKSLEYFNNLIRIEDNNYLNYYNRARAFYLLEDYSSALDDFLASLKLNPKYASSYYNIALCYAALDNPTECIKYYTKSIELNPKNLDAINNRGMAFMYLDNFESAIADFKIIIGKNNEYENAVNNIAICYQKNMEFKKAHIYLNKVLKKNKSNSTAYINRAINYYRMGQIKNAIADFSKAHRLQPENYTLYFFRAKIFLEIDYIDKAMNDAEKMIKLRPSEDGGYLMKAKILLKQKKYYKAQKYIEKAICFQPEYGELFLLRGNIYSALGIYEKAMNDYALSLKHDAMNPETYFSYGKICQIKGYSNLANLNFEKACSLDSAYYEKVDFLLKTKNKLKS